LVTRLKLENSHSARVGGFLYIKSLFAMQLCGTVTQGRGYQLGL
jgi:hypothetical protein